MKKVIPLVLSFLCSYLLCAQEGEIGKYHGEYLSGYASTGTFRDTVYSQWYTKNVKTDSMIAGEPWNVPIVENIDRWGTYIDSDMYTGDQYSVSAEEDALKIDFTNELPNNGRNYTDLRMTWTNWEKGATGSTPFDFGGDTLTGEIYAYSGKPINIWVLCKADADLNLRVDLGDGNGRHSNRISPRMSIQASDEYEWYYFTFSDTSLSDGPDVNRVGMFADSYSGGWLGVENGRYSFNTPPLFQRAGPDYFVLLDPDLITTIRLTIDDGDKGKLGDQKTLRIKKIQLGGDKPEQPTYTATLTMLDANGSPLANSVFEIEDTEFTTDSTGVLNITDLHEGTYILTGVGNYYSGTFTVSGSDLATEINTSITTEPELYTATLTMLDANGSPLANSVFEIEGTEYTADSIGVLNITSLPEGTYTITGVGNSYSGTFTVWESDLSAEVNLSTLAVGEVLAIELACLPNPANGYLVVKSAEIIASITLTSISGTAVKHQTINAAEGRINTADLATGTYILIVKTPSGKTLQKIILVN